MKRFDIAGYLEDRLERIRPSVGSELTAACPECGRYGGFYVNSESGKFVCFKCEFKGRSIVGLVAALEGCSEDQARSFVFKRAVEFRRRSDVVTLCDRVAALRPHAVKDDEPPVGAELPKGFRPVFDGRRWAFPRYLRTRDVKPATAKAWGLGIVHKGAIAIPGRERPLRLFHRLIIPIVCPAGSSWTARDMTGDQEPKYLNPAVDHRKLLIGWNMARLTGDLVLCEGPLDAIKLWQHRVSALAFGGKEMSDEQFGLLTNLPRELAVTVMLDPEEKRAPVEIAKRLTLHFRDVFIAHLPMGVDPGASTSTEAYKAIEGARRFTGARTVSVRAALDNLRSSVRWRTATGSKKIPSSP